MRLKNHHIVSFLLCFSFAGLAVEAVTGPNVVSVATKAKGIDSSWVRIRIFEKLNLELSKKRVTMLQ